MIVEVTSVSGVILEWQIEGSIDVLVSNHSCECRMDGIVFRRLGDGIDLLGFLIKVFGISSRRSIEGSSLCSDFSLS